MQGCLTTRTQDSTPFSDLESSTMQGFIFFKTNQKM